MTAQRKKQADPGAVPGQADAKGSAPAPKPTMTIYATRQGEELAETISNLSTDGLLPLTLTSHMYGLGLAGDQLDPTMMHARMTSAAQEAAAGKFDTLERMLSGQAQTLNIVFTELARRAALNMGTHLGATETYLRLALKAQAQSRATVEALAEMKNPRAVAFVKQANIAQQQQVNNGAPAPRARTEESMRPENEQSRLETPNEWSALDTGAKATPARSDPAVETVGAVHRAEDARGQGQGGEQ